jgi:CRISPR type IV-associated protein Csf3
MRLIEPGHATDTTTDPGWVPVHVTARLTEPVVNLTGHPAHLDGPVSYGAYQEYLHANGHAALPPMSGDHAVDFDLPIAAWTAPAPGPVHPLARAATDGLVWGWACSRAHYEPLAYTTIAVRRRPAVDEGARYTKDRRWHLSAGPTKARDVPHPAVHVTAVTWWALADPDRLKALLDRVPSLGRLGHHGHGRVASWTVRPCGERDAWRDRVWPHSDGTPDTIRAPYHHRTRMMPCRG